MWRPPLHMERWSLVSCQPQWEKVSSCPRKRNTKCRALGCGVERTQRLGQPRGARRLLLSHGRWQLVEPEESCAFGKVVLQSSSDERTPRIPHGARTICNQTCVFRWKDDMFATRGISAADPRPNGQDRGILWAGFRPFFRLGCPLEVHETPPSLNAASS